MDDLKAQFAYYMRVELGRHKSTIDEYLKRIRRLEQRFGKPMQDITSDDLRQLKADPQMSRSTIKAYLVTARAWHEWGALEDHWPLGTIAKVRTPQITDIVNRPALSMDKVTWASPELTDIRKVGRRPREDVQHGKQTATFEANLHARVQG